MATPKVEQIEVEMLARLEAISIAGGQNLDYLHVSRKLRLPEAVNDFPVLFCPPTREPGDLQVQENQRVLVAPVWGYANDEDDQATELNKIRQDVESVIYELEDQKLLGLAFVILIELHEVRKWQVAETFLELVRLEFHITYRYEQGDP